MAFVDARSGICAKASLFGAKTVWFPVLRELSNAESVEALKVENSSTRVVRLLFLKVSRRPVIYDDWASADVARAKTRRVLVRMASMVVIVRL